MKTYNPRERYCDSCGKLIILHNPKEYVYRRRDYRPESPTYNKSIFFCCNTCMTQYDSIMQSRKKYGGR